MIKAILIINNHGKIRLSRFYTKISQAKQQQLVRDVFAIVSKRSEAVCNFVEPSKSWQEKYRDLSRLIKGGRHTFTKEERALAEFFDSKLIYRHYATLFFVFLVDSSESELGILDLIQVFVESLDQRFENVCELDIVFRFDEVNNILDEIVMAGMVLETNLSEIMNAVMGQKTHEKHSKTVAKKSKTVIKGHLG